MHTARNFADFIYALFRRLVCYDGGYSGTPKTRPTLVAVADAGAVAVDDCTAA